MMYEGFHNYDIVFSKNTFFLSPSHIAFQMADPHMVDPTEDPLDVDGVDPADIHLKAVVVSEEMAVISIIDPPSVIILEDPPSVIILEDPHSMKTSKDPPSGEDPVVDPLDPGNVEAVEVAADLTTEVIICDHIIMDLIMARHTPVIFLFIFSRTPNVEGRGRTPHGRRPSWRTPIR